MQYFARVGGLTAMNEDKWREVESYASHAQVVEIRADPVDAEDFLIKIRLYGGSEALIAWGEVSQILFCYVDVTQESFDYSAHGVQNLGNVRANWRARDIILTTRFEIIPSSAIFLPFRIANEIPPSSPLAWHTFGWIPTAEEKIAAGWV